MRTNALLLFLVSAFLVGTPGQQINSEDEKAIRQLTVAFYERLARRDASGIAALFTADGDLWDFGGWPSPAVLDTPREPVRMASGRGSIERSLAKRKDWSEVSGPHVQSQSVRLLTPEVAIADTTVSYYGSMIIRQDVHGILVMKKERDGWRIASYRSVGRCSGP